MLTEETYLKAMKDHKELVIIYLINGIKLIGKIINFDNNCIFLTHKNEGVQILYKRSIATIMEYNLQNNNFEEN